MDMSVLRQYLAGPARQSADEVANDALLHQSPGALQLFSMVMHLRVNRRSRRSIDECIAAHALQDRPRWLRLATDVVWNVYRVFLTHSDLTPL